MARYDVIIVGGGIVGLATCLQLLKRKPDLKIAVIEKENKVASHQTGHNSGVIHSGIYYKPGSLKAQYCRRGYDLLLQFCDEHSVPYDICGKIIIAVQTDEIPRLDQLFARGLANGLNGLRIIHPEEIRQYEPFAAGVRGIYVPQTGIVDYVCVAQAMAGKNTQKGADIYLGEKVRQIVASTVITDRDNYSAKLIITCAGLHSDRLAGSIPEMPVRIIPFRGEYYRLKPTREHLVKNLIYPVPDPNFPFLGVHFTRMINGGLEAGPNAVLAFKREGYRKRDVNIRDIIETAMWPGFHTIVSKYWRTGIAEMYRTFSKKVFTHALQKLVPSITSDDLMAGGSGVRAQACSRDGHLLDDFLLHETATAIHVLNAPSPAATSSLAIGEQIALRSEQRLAMISR